MLTPNRKFEDGVRVEQRNQLAEWSNLIGKRNDDEGSSRFGTIVRAYFNQDLDCWRYYVRWDDRKRNEQVNEQSIRAA